MSHFERSFGFAVAAGILASASVAKAGDTDGAPPKAAGATPSLIESTPPTPPAAALECNDAAIDRVKALFDAAYSAGSDTFVLRYQAYRLVWDATMTHCEFDMARKMKDTVSGLEPEKLALFRLQQAESGLRAIGAKVQLLTS
jgi:hypothetical protein